jgi:hypothetical protein
MCRSFLFYFLFIYILLNNTLGQKIASPAYESKNSDSILFLKPGIYFDFGLTGSIYSVRDRATSPLIYKGFIPGFNIGVDYYSSKLRINLNYSFSYGFLKTRNYPLYDGNTPESYNNLLYFNVLFKISKKNNNGLNIFAGLGSSITANFRLNPKYYNADFNYEFIGGLGPAFQVEKIWKSKKDYINLGLLRYPLKKRSFKLSTNFSFPVIAATLRPTYTTVSDFVGGESDIELKNTKFTSFNNLFAFIGEVNFYYYLLNRNAFKISYMWKYYNYRPKYNPVNSINGSFNISILFRLNK